MDYIADKILGRKIFDSSSSEDKYFADMYQEEIREALNSGKSIYLGRVDHEQAHWRYCKFFEEIWKILEEKSHGDFEAIQDDLSY